MKYTYKYRYECFNRGLGYVLVNEQGIKVFKPDNENKTYTNKEYYNCL